MTYDPETYSTAELARLVKDVGAGLKAVSQKIDELDGKVITRAEFEAWHTSYDREIRDLKQQSTPIKTSGWTIAAFAVSAIVGAGTLLTVLTNVIP